MLDFRDIALTRTSDEYDRVPIHLDLPGRVDEWQAVDVVFVSGRGNVESDEINASRSKISRGARSAHNFDVFRIASPTIVARAPIADKLHEAFPDCFQLLDARCDAFPVRLVYPFLTYPDVIDWDRTKPRTYFSTGRVMCFDRLVIKDLDGRPDVFSIEEYPGHLVASERFIAFIKDRGIRGYDFTEVYSN